MAMERSFGCIALDRPGEALRLYADSEVLEAVRRALAKGKSSIGEDAGQRLAALLQRALGAEETARPGEGIVVAASAEAALELVRRALAATGGRLGPVPQRQGAGHLREQPERSDGKRARGQAGEERQSPGRSGASLDDADEEPNAWQVELRPDSAWSWRPVSGAGAGEGAGADAGGRAAAGGGAGADAGGRAAAGEGAGATPPAKRGAPGGHAARRLLAVGSLASGVPGLGAAWASGPPELLRRVREEQRRSGAASGWELLVMEELLGLGELEPRRAAAAAACEAALQELEEALDAASMPAGLRWRRDPRGAAMELLLPEGLDARALQRAARLRGLCIGVAGAGLGAAPGSGAARLAAGAASGAQLAMALSGLAEAMREFTARS
ncbi:hypothetical protein [Paenibacillus sp. B01]|uniref:hypothetical protein n=1 Tax=Paenibacillus sp. B01 TaxID=2660554 RepID=UPI001891B78E|nr:hypothetical protein [Paenibacillus sp. B01]